MQLDTRLPLLAAQQPALQFQRETRLESLGKIAPAINAMRQLQAQQIDMETELRKRQAFDQFRAAAQQAGLSGDLGQLAQVFFTHGQSPEHFKIGTDLMKAAQEDARNRRLFGYPSEQAAAMAAPTGAPSMERKFEQAPASEAAPEMAMGAAGGAQPVNAMMAMEAPAVPMPAARPAGVYRFGDRTYTQAQIDEMSSHKDTRSFAEAIIKANEPKQDEIANRMKMMGLDPSKQSDWARYHEISRASESSPEIVKLQAQVDALPANDPRRKALQDRIDVLSTRQAPVQVNLPKLESSEQKGKGELNVKEFEGIASAAKIATRTLPSLETQERVLNAGFQTGFGAEAKKVGASILSALGVPEAERFASNAETFVAAMNQSVLQRQLEQKGPQTEADAQRISATGAQLGNTVQGNRFIIAVAKAQLKRDISQRRFWEEYWRKNKTYEGAEEAWQSGPGGKSLFDAPELREFVRATTPPSAPQAGGAGAARSGGGGGTARPSGGGVDRNNPLLRQE